MADLDIGSWSSAVWWLLSERERESGERSPGPVARFFIKVREAGPSGLLGWLSFKCAEKTRRHVVKSQEMERGGRDYGKRIGRGESEWKLRIRAVCKVTDDGNRPGLDEGRLLCGDRNRELKYDCDPLD